MVTSVLSDNSFAKMAEITLCSSRYDVEEDNIIFGCGLKISRGFRVYTKNNDPLLLVELERKVKYAHAKHHIDGHKLLENWLLVAIPTDNESSIHIACECSEIFNS
jgi:hypothetical protein